MPEPVDTSADPTLGAERGEALELALMFLLEKLTPAERAAYVLREAFEYSHSEIAEVLQTTEGNARQIAARARKHITGERRAPAGKDEQERLLRAFIAAAQLGELSGLEQLFGADVRVLFRRRRRRSCSARPGARPWAGIKVYRGICFPFLDRGHHQLGRSKRRSSRAAFS